MTTAHAKRRKHEGVVYTPPLIVEHILRHTLDDRLARRRADQNPLRLLDPACGDGAFLTAACLRFFKDHRERTGAAGYQDDLPATPSRLAIPSLPRDAMHRMALVRSSIFGIDIDSHAVMAARRRLAALILLGKRDSRRLSESDESLITQLAEALTENIACCDALAKEHFPERRRQLQTGAFDVIVANPPFVGARRLALRNPLAAKAARRQVARTHSGGCDLYIQFVERIWELLADGGCFGMVAPNRIAVVDYARRCRELLLTEGRIDRIDDISELRAFPEANVYPVILCAAKERACSAHAVRIARVRSLKDCDNQESWTIRQSALRPELGFPLDVPLDLESRAPTRPLSEIAVLHSGATGFVAARLADALRERGDAPAEAWDFITTGNIDRYWIRRGNVRFLRRSFRRPVLPSNAEFLSARKRRLYSQPKIVLAGMSRRIEAAWSGDGLALGVQVYAAADIDEDPFFLLAILNSALMAYLFRIRFQAKRMNGGYLAINKGQLARLPIRTMRGASARARQLHDELAEAAQQLTIADESARTETRNKVRSNYVLERRIDAAVFELYGVTESEIAAIESEIEDPSSLARKA